MIVLPTITRRTVHDLNHEKRRYQLRICPPGFTAVPQDLTVEDRRFNRDINADLLLSGPKTKDQDSGKRKANFFTGLQPTRYADVYTGSIRSKGKGGKMSHSYLLARFTPDANTLTILYFPGFGGPYPNQRDKFVTEVIVRGLL
ncbi:hypothetical protein [Spirosoma fluviale]|uniref:Uncharacterized protein n=1 Tax=Spirosoma fluviale TaxID=1597977 RepID=A0A286GLI3_9BACT|nr:hypothetical protein [Spirosoma fluviale]SOD96401.1 hypothetical protein SAMN06269250_5290 [Spirosoma fluviale]